MARYSAAEALWQIMRISPKRNVDHPFVDNVSWQGCWWSETKTRDNSLLHYNAPKSNVNNVDLDHLACIYSCKRKINRTWWPIVLFINMLDTTGIVSFVIWMCKNPDWNKSSKAIRPRQFILSLGECFAEPLIIGDVSTMQPSSEDQSRMQSNFYSWTLEKLKQELKDQLKWRHRDFVTCAHAGLTRRRANSAISALGLLVQHTLSIDQM